MKDWNICPYCNQCNSLKNASCDYCGQAIVLPAQGAFSIWRLGPIRDGLIGDLSHDLSAGLGIPCVIQPAMLDWRPSERPAWKGLSANVFLEQVHRRWERGGVACLGITEDNIVPSARYNFLFGLAYLGLPAATASIHTLASDDPPEDLLRERIAGIALHELGHSFGLDHHSYEEGVDCLMNGDVAVDSLETVDAGGGSFCDPCFRHIQKKITLLLRNQSGGPRTAKDP